MGTEFALLLAGRTVSKQASGVVPWQDRQERDYRILSQTDRTPAYSAKYLIHKVTTSPPSQNPIDDSNPKPYHDLRPHPNGPTPAGRTPRRRQGSLSHFPHPFSVPNLREFPAWGTIS